ncbi:MAG: adenine phosphoribosyltransferase [Austwickia sp.]|nr:adenine phosphoribosyltransferase [Austwickia sp.]MBK9101223.1 adenine phosphoribosyltransferase [Austwickia sp.]
MDRTALAALVTARLRDVPDFPEPGVVFKDFTPLLADPEAMAAVVADVRDRFGGRVDMIVGIEARGFMIGAATAYALGVGFVPIRKSGKLPRQTHQACYELEYGTACVEIHADALTQGHRVLVMDDVLATGGTAEAACDLVERAGGTVVGVDVVVELGFLKGRDKLTRYEVSSVLVI